MTEGWTINGWQVAGQGNRPGLARFLRTVCHLNARQLYYLLRSKVYRPQADTSPGPQPRVRKALFVRPPARKPELLQGPEPRFLFHGDVHAVVDAADWNDGARGSEWLHCLHGFGELMASDAAGNEHVLTELIRRWIRENTPGEGVGWRPISLSVRICNWIMWRLLGRGFPDDAYHSLVVQTRYLSKCPEYHLPGNHLLTNAKALLFAGAFFHGEEAESWLRVAIEMLGNQLEAQILPDGGHYERSPMYQSQTLRDLLDVMNVLRAYELPVPHGWSDLAAKMLSWTLTMSHPDGDIVLFNDAALASSHRPDELELYAAKLGVRIRRPHAQMNQAQPRKSVHRAQECRHGPCEGGLPAVTWLSDTGYARVDAGVAVAFLDLAPLGPDFLPGHGHADTFTFELSIHGKRVIVDTGTSTYSACPERLYHAARSHTTR